MQTVDALKEAFLTFLQVALTGFDDMIQASVNTIGKPIDESTWASMVGLSGILKPFCYLVIGLCTCIELAQTASKVDMLKWEHALKTGIKLCLAYVCIDIAPTFLKACFVQSQAWISSLARPNNIKLGSDSYDAISLIVDNIDGFGSIMGLWLAMFIVLLAILVSGLLIQVIAYGRMFEIYVYLVVSPLPFAFLPLGQGDNFSRTTTRFVKSFIAVCLQGVMLLVTIQVFNVILGTMLGQLITDTALAEGDEFAKVVNICFSMLIGSISLLMAVSRSGEWARAVIDAS